MDCTGSIWISIEAPPGLGRVCEHLEEIELEVSFITPRGERASRLGPHLILKVGDRNAFHDDIHITISSPDPLLQEQLTSVHRSNPLSERIMAATHVINIKIPFSPDGPGRLSQLLWAFAMAYGGIIDDGEELYDGIRYFISMRPVLEEYYYE